MVRVWFKDKVGKMVVFLDSLKHLGECRSEFYEDLMTIHAKGPST